MTHTSLEAIAKNNDVFEDLVKASLVPITLLPRWYWGVASVGSVTAMIVNHNAILDIPLYLSAMPLYGPLLPIGVIVALVIAVCVAIAAIAAIVAIIIGLSVGVPMIGRFLWRNTVGRLRTLFRRENSIAA